VVRLGADMCSRCGYKGVRVSRDEKRRLIVYVLLFLLNDDVSKAYSSQLRLATAIIGVP
jgi:hypothetical protein